jgi:hypothetical protein
MLRAVDGLSFLSVNVFAALVVPTVTVPKARLVGEAASGTKPVPARPIRSGDPTPPEYANVKSPETPPTMEGLKVTVMLQCPPAVSDAPQVLAETV